MKRGLSAASWYLPSILMALSALIPQPSEASCNVIPGTSRSFRGTLGTIDRPFASPYEWVQIHLNEACAADASTGLGNSVDDLVVSFVFKPPQGPRSVVVLAPDCEDSEMTASLDACEGTTRVAKVHCVRAGADLAIRTVDGEPRLFVRFPDTDSFVGDASDARTYTGPVAIAVTKRGTPLPCQLAKKRCVGVSGALVACIDEFFDSNGSCDASPHPLFPGFTALPPGNAYQELCTDPPSICKGGSRELRMTSDAEGNLLVPLDWLGVIPEVEIPVARLLGGGTTVAAFRGSSDAIVVPGESFLQSFAPEGALLPPIFRPRTDGTVSDRLSLFGSADAPKTVLRVLRRSPALLECHGGDNDGLPCLTSKECAGGACAVSHCPNTTICDSDDDCSNGECGPGLFEFRDRYENGGVGPIVVSRSFNGADAKQGICSSGPEQGEACLSNADCESSGSCDNFAWSVDLPVLLETLAETSAISTFVMSEGIESRDLNGDEDAQDFVLTLRERERGSERPLGRPQQCGGDASVAGRAVVRSTVGAFRYAALAREDDVLAFLESEPAQRFNGSDAPGEGARSVGSCDLNGDGDHDDAILRVFRANGEELSKAIAPARALDASPLVNGKALAVVGKRVVYRVAESAMTPRRLRLASTTADGAAGNKNSFRAVLSGDGRYVVFASNSDNLVEGDANDVADIFVKDLQTGAIKRVSFGYDGEEADGASDRPWISSDGRVVAFASGATNLVPGDTNESLDVFVREWRNEAKPTERASVGMHGEQAECPPPPKMCAGQARLSANGSLVVFESEADNLVPGDSGVYGDTFLRDRRKDTTERISVGLSGEEPDGASATNSVPSSDGRYVAFASTAENLTEDDSNDAPDVFVRDRLCETTKRVTASAPCLAETSCGANVNHSLSSDGATIVFNQALADNVPGDTNSVTDTFARDIRSLRTERVSVSSSGAQADGASDGNVWAAGNGRFVGFQSDAYTLVEPPNPDIGFNQAYLHDRMTGHTVALSTKADGEFADQPVQATSSSDDGRIATFDSDAGNLIGGVPAGSHQVYVSEPASPPPPGSDLFEDGKADDTVLEILDTESSESPAPVTLCPAGRVAACENGIAWLQPESQTSTSRCRRGSLNGDADRDDQVVQRWRPSGGQENLGLAAVDVVCSNEWIAVLAREGSGQPSNSASGGVVEAHAMDGAAGTWMNLGVTAGELRISGDLLAYSVAHAGAPACDEPAYLGVTRLGAAPEPLPRLALKDFAISDRLVAFVVPESAEGKDLNCDGDREDDVLHVYDAVVQKLLNSKETVVACPLAACDPTRPFKVGSSTVTFLTLEAKAGRDLDGDGNANGLILQILNVPKAIADAASSDCDSASSHLERTMVFGELVAAGSLTTVASTAAGVCTSSGDPCFHDEQCTAGGRCSLPPGECVEDRGAGCDPNCDKSGGGLDGCCPDGEFCIRNAAMIYSCHASLQLPCASREDCGAGDLVQCSSPANAVTSLVGPLEGDSGTLVSTAGRCLEVLDGAGGCTSQAECPPESYCDKDGVCVRGHGPCGPDTTCPPGSTCKAEVFVAASDDQDGDEIPDTFDNCPAVFNPDQSDEDRDGFGTRCDETLTACGDANHDGIVAASDALAALKVAVGIGSCPANVCDTNADGGITALDAITILRHAASPEVQLECVP